MSIIVRPLIYIGGRQIWWGPSSTEVAAVSAITIPWGRERILDQVEGHAATLEIIDPDGTNTFLAGATMIGQKVVIEIAGVKVLTGQVSGETASSAHVVLDGIRREVIRVQVTVRDLTGILNSMRPAGDATSDHPYGQGGWLPAWLPDRVRQLVAKSGGWMTSAEPPAYRHREGDMYSAATAAAAPARTDQRPTVLNALCQVYAASSALGWPSIMPDGTVQQGAPATCSDIVLKRDSSGMYAPRSLDGQVSANLFGLDSVHQLVGSSASDRPTVVHSALESTGYSLDTTNGGWQSEDMPVMATAHVPLNSPVAEAQELDLKLGATSGWYSTAPIGAGHVNTATARINAAQLIADRAADLVAKLAIFHRLPPMTIHGSDTAAQFEMWRTHVRGPFWISGSKWAQYPSVPRCVQIIGGELVFDKHGWHHTVHLAPTIDTLPRDLLLDQLIPPTSTLSLDALDPDTPLNALIDVSRSEIQ